VLLIANASLWARSIKCALDDHHAQRTRVWAAASAVQTSSSSKEGSVPPSSTAPATFFTTGAPKARPRRLVALPPRSTGENQLSQAQHRAAMTHRSGDGGAKGHHATRLRPSKSTGNLVLPAQPFLNVPPISLICAIEKYASGDVALRDVLRDSTKLMKKRNQRKDCEDAHDAPNGGGTAFRTCAMQ
jgi:hypothetical protein